MWSLTVKVWTFIFHVYGWPKDEVWTISFFLFLHVFILLFFFFAMQRNCLMNGICSMLAEILFLSCKIDKKVSFKNKKLWLRIVDVKQNFYLQLFNVRVTAWKTPVKDLRSSSKKCECLLLSYSLPVAYLAWFLAWCSWPFYIIDCIADALLCFISLTVQITGCHSTPGKKDKPKSTRLWKSSNRINSASSL